jgi:hypothetical protein
VTDSVSLPALLDTFGRSDITGTFWDGQQYGRDPVKQLEREKVCDFFLEVSVHFPGTRLPLRVVSFPGADWSFEYLLLNSVKSQFVGLERSKTVYQRARRAIPGVKHSWTSHHHCLLEKQLLYGKGQIIYSRVKARSSGGGICTRSNRLVLMDAEVYTSLFFEDYNAPMKDREEVWKRFYNRNAVWLDYTSQLHDSIERTLKRLPFVLEPPSACDYQKPVVITVLNARDQFHSAEQRVQRMIEVQPALQPVKHWTYVGKGGVSMLTACFLVR